MKLLLYCTKAKPYLFESINEKGKYMLENDEWFKELNGKIVAECDFEVEEHKETTNDWLCMSLREKIVFGNLCEKANIDELECYKYADGKPLYAIHIKNLHIFDKPRELSEYYSREKKMNTFDWYRLKGYECVCESIDKAPQNMMYAQDENQNKQYILISIQPQWLCKILNGEKTIEVRKKVLKEMLI